jgi:hypothetical protein
LEVLTNRFREIVLVDWDTDAMKTGVKRQFDRIGTPNSGTVKLIGGVDLSAIGSELMRFSHHSTSPPSELELLIDRLSSVDRALEGGPFSVVASTCLLSQLFNVVFQTIGEKHPWTLTLIQALRKHHLRQLIDNTKPGGHIVFITDIVSSATCRALFEVREDKLIDLVRELIEQSNFFTGLNPGILEKLFRGDPDFAPRVSDVSTVRPWLWDLGPRTYLVIAFIARRIDH